MDGSARRLLRRTQLILRLFTFSESFTIKLPAPAPVFAPSDTGITSSTSSASSMLTLLTFYETTPTFTMGSPTSGIVELDEGIARLLGVDRGFYIAVCLAFLQFLEDKQVHTSDGSVLRRPGGLAGS